MKFFINKMLYGSLLKYDKLVKFYASYLFLTNYFLSLPLSPQNVSDISNSSLFPLSSERVTDHFSQSFFHLFVTHSSLSPYLLLNVSYITHSSLPLSFSSKYIFHIIHFSLSILNHLLLSIPILSSKSVTDTIHFSIFTPLLKKCY